MERLKTLIHDDEDAVSPVIGVILMVAITVILAAVIASFVIGLGDQQDPAPTPQFDIEQDEKALNFTKAGGNDFEVDDAEITATITLENTSSDQTAETEFDIEDINDTTRNDAVSVSTGPNNEDYDVYYNITNLPNGEMTAGDEFNFGVVPTTGVPADNDVEIAGWDLELVWAPEGADSEIIYESTA